MFIPRIWDNKVERIGKQRCTPAGYVLQMIGELIGFAGLLTLIAVVICLLWTAFAWPNIWVLGIPFVIGFIGWLMVAFSWWMAGRKDFHYDFEKIEASWIDNGERRVLTLEDLKDKSRDRNI